MVGPSDPLDDWFAEHRSQRMAHQMREIESAKVVTTFVVGISALVLVTMIQIRSQDLHILDLVSTGLFIGSGIAAYQVFVRDELRLANPTAVIKAMTQRDERRALEDLRLAEDTALEKNEDVQDRVRAAMRWALFLASASGVLSLLEMLWPLLSRV